jgi:hypothetical protein
MEYVPTVNNQEYILSTNNSYDYDYGAYEDHLEVFDGKVNLKMNADLMALVGSKEVGRSVHFSFPNGYLKNVSNNPE